jgi:sugar (pentulose or hexulose) kinase
LAGIGSGLFPDTSAAVRAARREELTVEPNKERSERLQARYNEVYRGLYEQLRKAHHQLHSLAS